MDIEEAYRLTDTYIQECERCQSVESVKTLQYNLLIDFTERVGEAKMPSGITDDVYEAIQFIKLHTNAPIGVNDVVNSVCVSKNWLNKKVPRTNEHDYREIYYILQNRRKQEFTCTLRQNTIRNKQLFLFFLTILFSEPFQKAIPNFANKTVTVRLRSPHSLKRCFMACHHIERMQKSFPIENIIILFAAESSAAA